METLNSMMEVDHVIRVAEDGSIDEPTNVHAPDVHVDTDDDGQILDAHDEDMIESVKAQGWSLLTGWTRQDSYRGPIMHPSEYVGGALEQYIRETPGLWCVVMVETFGDDEEPAGWALAYRES